MKIDLYNQIYNSAKCNLDSMALGIALGLAPVGGVLIDNQLTASFMGGVALDLTGAGMALGNIAYAASQFLVSYANGIQILNTALNGIIINDASTSALSILKSNAGNINITNTAIGGNINLAPDDEVTTTKDIFFTDISHGVTMKARWTDNTHSAPGVKSFRIYVEDDLGTISVEEI